VLAAVDGVGAVTRRDEQVTFTTEHDDATLLGLTAALTEAGVAIRALIPEQLTLEHVFFDLTERRAAPEPATV
jgi:hypothetical protein